LEESYARWQDLESIRESEPEIKSGLSS
jgi:hypothetical protein